MLAPMKSAALIVNPFASAVTEERLRAVEEELSKSYSLAVALTERPKHATELARELGDVDALFVYGGDGLLNEVLNGLGKQTAVGVLPGGRTNVVARALRVPSEPAEAARALVGAPTHRISLGRVNGRRFAFSAGLGFDAELVRRVDRRGRRSDGRRPGDLVFAWETTKLLAGWHGRREPLLEIEGFGHAAFLLVANGYPYSYAGRRPVKVAPEARFELGLDLVAPRRLTPHTIPRFVGYAFRGGAERAEDVLYGHDLDRIDVRSEGPLPLQVDGEDLGDVEKAVFEAERDAVSILTPHAGTLTA